MVYLDKWNTMYSNELKEYIKPREIIDISPSIQTMGDFITRNARTTDDAIMKIHEWMKVNGGIGHVPLFLDIPVRKASDQVDNCKINPDGKNLCVQKTIMEVALLRSQGIPSRVGVSLCGTSSARLRFSPILERIVKTAPWLTEVPLFPHAFTEVYSFDENGDGNFRRKDSYISEKHCKKFKDACMEDEIKQWKEKRDIPNLQSSLNCKKIESSVDFPTWLAVFVNSSVISRDATHVIDLIDPLHGEKNGKRS